MVCGAIRIPDSRFPINLDADEAEIAGYPGVLLHAGLLGSFHCELVNKKHA